MALSVADIGSQSLALEVTLESLEKRASRSSLPSGCRQQGSITSGLLRSRSDLRAHTIYPVPACGWGTSSLSPSN